MSKAPVTAVIIAKDEARSIVRCINSLQFCDQVMVIDSSSSDGTQDLAIAAGAELHTFDWNRQYPKKKQWGMSLPAVRNEWVLHMDADEVVTDDLAREIQFVLGGGTRFAAFQIPLSYYFSNRELKHGHRVLKTSLLNRTKCKFPDVGDEMAPGITEVEGHYQPTVSGDLGTLKSHLKHEDLDPLADWISRHNRYSDWEAYLRTHPELRARVHRARSGGGRLFERLPGKPLMFFLYSYIFKAGFLDGRAGFEYAFALSFYYWSTSAKTREMNRQSP